MTNLPQDWDSYYAQCSACGHRYHASGTETCACFTCEYCDEDKPPAEMSSLVACIACVDGENLEQNWADVMVDVHLKVIPGVPVYLSDDAALCGVVVTVEGSQVFWTSGSKVMESMLSELRVDLDDKQGFAWAATIALADDDIHMPQSFWDGITDRSYTNQTTDDDRLAIAQELALRAMRG